jgi:hypothetical protein
MRYDMDTPNLDCMSYEELRSFAVAVGSAPVKTARELFPDRQRGYVRAALKLKGYAWNKLTAIACRQRGDIEAAMVYENICDRIYDDLPEFAKW